jgi:hypothetical protein
VTFGIGLTKAWMLATVQAESLWDVAYFPKEPQMLLFKKIVGDSIFVI